jgi:hypothetical protein
MKTIIHKNGTVELTDTDYVIKDIDDLFNLFGVAESSAIIIKKENIIADFFDLSSGFAGEILQKCSNYRMKLAIVGDYSQIKSKALQDFIYESNQRRQIIFVQSTQDALEIFGE